MSLDTAFQGSLFASDFLCAAITELPDWQELDDASIEDLEAALGAICDRFPAAASPNESQTEDDLIWPVLARLGWTVSLRQQNLSAYGREDVPDGLLFADEAARTGLTASPRSASATSLVSRWWSPSAGCARSTAAPGRPARRRRHRPRCCAICGASTI